ncbi:MAG: GTPase [Armatimonadetes bacterium]|nr:GTPase [Armatimonadota bacterium]
MQRIKVLIMGAAGRDFHNFNVYFRTNPFYEVIAFTAAQIPNIEGRIYPPELSGKLYPKGIPIYEEKRLEELILKNNIEEAIFSYSDISHLDLMHKASTVIAKGADFKLMGPEHTMLKSTRPIVSICAARTGAGKSQTTRKVCKILRRQGLKVIVVRHPMPYGNLKEQICQRFESFEDLIKNNCTIEEQEEYAPHLENGIIVYAGIDYEKILKSAEKEAQIIIWDGGNNDFPFFKSDLSIVLVDPLRPNHEIFYHPGEVNLKMADIIIINKVESALKENIHIVKENIKINNPEAKIIEATSPISTEDPNLIQGKIVLAIEDGPTITHGEMSYGAAVLASKNFRAKEVIDPRPYAQGSIKEIYAKYPHLGEVLPAMGYSKKQIKELEETIEAAPCDLVVIGTPVDLRKIMKISKEAVKIRYELEELGHQNLEYYLKEFIEKCQIKALEQKK